MSRNYYDMDTYGKDVNNVETLTHLYIVLNKLAFHCNGVCVHKFQTQMNSTAISLHDNI